MSDYEIRSYRPGDEELILEAWNRHLGGSLGPRGLDDWNWVHRANPAGGEPGPRIALALHGGRVVAHYASQPTRVITDGEEHVFSQVVDAFADPDHASAGGEAGLLVETARRMLAESCGPNLDLVAYHWPEEGLWEASKAHLRFEMVRMQTVLARDVAPLRLAPEACEIGPLTELGEEVRWLYDRCAGEWGASGLRDAAYLDWRFVQNPRRDYALLGARDREGLLRGYAVHRPGDWPGPGATWLVDWLVPAGEEEVGRALLAALLAHGRAAGSPRLLAMFPEWSPWFQRFQEWGFQVHATHLVMAARKTHPRHEMYWLRDHWWYQPADLELV